LIFLYALLPSIIGLAVGIEQLYREYRKLGRWKFRGNRFVFLVVPSLYISLYYFVPRWLDILTPVFGGLIYNSRYTSVISSILFGYFLITCFEKEEEKNFESKLGEVDSFR
ncbi:hypothetical protein, partial [Paenibacillus alkalitolerans]|uniref:hypothetical protein n=1 Tax=Paenibacillus alkalitolerans TaxID=2799335 RepID=UPI001F24FDF2